MKENIVTALLIVSCGVFLVSLFFFSWASVALSCASMLLLAMLETTLSIRRRTP